MPKILVLYYSMYGHVETMAAAIAEGARSVEGADVTVKRVPETMTPDVAKRNGAKLDQAAPVATPAELTDYDAIIFGTPSQGHGAQMATSSTRPAVLGQGRMSAGGQRLLQHRSGATGHHELRQHPHASRRPVTCACLPGTGRCQRGEGGSGGARRPLPVRMDRANFAPRSGAGR